MTRTEPISYVEATIRALEEDNAELLAEIERLRAALDRAAVYFDALNKPAYALITRAALTAQPAAPGGDND
jgi:hypothetical protein